MRRVFAAVCASMVLLAFGARAEIKIGAVLSLTGAAASLGIPERNAIDLMPRQIGSEVVRYIVLDDASDPTTAVRAARRLIDEEKVDIIFGPSVTPTSLALLEILAPARTAMISFAGSAIIASPVAGNKQWAFKLAPEEPTMGAYIFDNLAKTGHKSVGFIGFNDSFGESFIGAMKKIAAERGVTVTADERYNRTDTSATAQALKVMGSNPAAIIIAGSGTPGVTPVLELRKLNYQGQIYLNQGMANADVLRVGGAALNDTFMPVSPVLVAEQLPDTHPVKPVATRFVQAYETKYGPNSRSLFGATAWDAFLIVEQAVPIALAAGQPGTPEFRTGLRDAIRTTKDLVGTQGVFTMSPTDHNGTDMRAQVLVQVKAGKWTYVPRD